MAATKTRRLDLDRGKGLGILLVVLGHIVAFAPPRGDEWYLVFKYGLYEFHMAFFMYLSGYVTFLTGAARVAPANWPRFVSNRAARLLPPFFVFWFVIVSGKLFASHFMFVDNMPSSPLEALTSFVWNTDSSAARTVWYLIVLFALSTIVPPILWKLRGRTDLLVVIALLIYPLPVPHVLYLDHIAKFFVFFAIGGLASDAGDRWLAWVDRYYGAALVGLFAAMYVTIYLLPDLTDDTKLFICGVISIPALHGVVRRTRLANSNTLLTLGVYSMAIYLLNTPCIGLTKGLMLKLVSWDGVNFVFYGPLLVAAGTLVPIWLKRHLLRRIPVVDRMTT